MGKYLEFSPLFFCLYKNRLTPTLQFTPTPLQPLWKSGMNFHYGRLFLSQLGLVDLKTSFLSPTKELFDALDSFDSKFSEYVYFLLK